MVTIGGGEEEKEGGQMQVLHVDDEAVFLEEVINDN